MIKTIKINHKKELTLSEAEELISQIRSKVNSAKEKNSREILKKESKASNSPKYFKKLEFTLKTMMELLSKPDYPENGITSHFGVSEFVDNDSLAISNYELTDKMLITLYRARNQYLPNGKQVGYSKEEHDKRVECLVKALGDKTKILDRWNGDTGQAGVSIIVNTPIPPALLTALNNYRRIDSPFSLKERDKKGYEDFNKFYTGVNS